MKIVVELADMKLDESELLILPPPNLEFQGIEVKYMTSRV